MSGPAEARDFASPLRPPRKEQTVRVTPTNGAASLHHDDMAQDWLNHAPMRARGTARQPTLPAEAHVPSGFPDRQGERPERVG